MHGHSPQLGRTLASLTPPVMLATGLSIAGLWLTRQLLDPAVLRASNDVVGNYLQTVGAIYAVLLAFVVFAVWQQFNETRAHIEREANEIIDLHRTVAGLTAVPRDRLHVLLREYVDAVLDEEWPAMGCGDRRRMEAGARLLDQAWKALHPFEPDLECHKALYGEALVRFNDLSDGRTMRLSAASLRLPVALRLLLYLGALVMVGSMYLFAVDSFAVHAAITGALAGAVSHVLYVIEDLDDAFAGAWQVPREPFERARAYIAREQAGVGSSA